MMRAGALILAALALPFGAAAADPAGPEAEVLPRVLSALPIEISEDHIGQETAVLLRSAVPNALSADLVILTGFPDDARAR